MLHSCINIGYGLIKVFVFDPHTVEYQKAGIGGSGFTDVLPQDIKWFFVLGFQHLLGYDLQIAPYEEDTPWEPELE